MNVPSPVALPPPSARRLAVATVGALVVAAIVLVVAVLPVEYGVDPTGAGRVLGLLRTSGAEVAAPAVVPDSEKLAPTPMGPAAYYGREYAVDHATFDLGPYEYLEYKYRLEAGATMQFTWEASAPVIHDLHAETDAGDEVSFDKSERARAFGSHTAPVAGMHGWYWENPGGSRIRIVVTSAGFYSAAVEYRSNRTRRVHELIALGTLRERLTLNTPSRP